MPSNTIANEFLIAVEAPIAAPSANISWKPSPTSAPMVADNVWDKIDLIIDWWNSDYGIESTVVKVDEEDWKWKVWILRPWFITKEDLELFFEGQDVEVEYTSKEKNMSPWTRFKHYSIPWEIIIINHINEISSSYEEPTALIATNERLIGEWIKEEKNLNIIKRWTEENLASCAHNLFQIYHECEKKWIKKVFIQNLSENGLGFAIMNRVKRSADKTATLKE
jgi:L-threonylcarbamoyladenylate synthase